MANYYYATVRVYTTTSSGSPTTCYNNKLETNSIIVAATGNIIWYVVDVYKSSLSTFSAWAAAYNSANGTLDGTLVPYTQKSVTINLNTTDQYILIDQLNNTWLSANGWLGQSWSNPGPTLNKPYLVGSGNGGSSLTAIDYINSHIIFPVTHKGGAEGGNGPYTCTPTFTIRQTDPQNGNGGAAMQVSGVIYLGQKPSTAGDLTTTSSPTIGFSTNVAQPTFPAQIIQNQFAQFIRPTQSFWYKCVNKWYVAMYDSHAGVTTTYSFNEDGSGKTQLISGLPGNTPALKSDWSKKNLALITAAIADLSCTDPAALANPGGSNGLVTTYLPTVPPTDQDRYNPPPHVSSRGVSFGERIAAKNASGQTLPASAVTDIFTQVQTQNIERGRIIQDASSAAVLNSNFDKINLPSPKSLWGFRFMYNPTGYSYTTSSNNSVDWTLGSKDPATLMAGNQIVTLQLYLNRIADLSYLRDYTADPNSVPPLSSSYISPDGSGGISPEAVDGILHRGTEYDIEFLYRVLNGDPLENPLLFGGDYQSRGYTADFGYTTATPCWLYLSDNIRYFGSVTSLTVNHAMFDMNMVPMFSTVDISFTRYPALWTDKAANSNGLTYASSIQALQSSLNPTPVAGTGKAPTT